MQYSEFGRQFVCKRCNRLAHGKIGVGVPPHWLAVICMECGKYHDWLKKRQEHEPANPLVDDATPIQWKRPQPTIQPPSLFDGM